MKPGTFIAVFLLMLSILLELAASDELSKKWFFTRRRRRRRHCRPVPCHVSQWCSWSACSRTCGGHGTQFRTRHITENARCGGGCSFHHFRESRPCNKVCFNGGVWRLYRCQCKNGYNGECCESKAKVNGRWTRWSSWSQCSKTCGKGYKYRTRTCTNPPPANGGRKCWGSGRQTRRCCLKASCKVNGGWSKWSKWSPSSKTCGGLIQHGRVRTRTCTNPPPSNGGRYCTGRDKQYMTLWLPRCPVRVDGGWSNWGAWCKCSKTCGAGIQYRKRSCNNPKPSHGGKPCQGKDRHARTCHMTPCMPSYNHKGCFKDTSSRAMPKYLGAHGWDAVAECAKKSYKLEYKCFGVQNGGECWTGPNAHRTYSKYKKCSKCRNGKGGAWANDVYCFAGVPGLPPVTSKPKTTKRPTAKPTTERDCWSSWVESKCTKPCGCGVRARTRYCKCGEGKFGSCKGLPLETFKCNCQACQRPVDA